MFMGCIKYINSVSFLQINIMHVCVCMYKYPPSSQKECMFTMLASFITPPTSVRYMCMHVCVLYLGACKIFIPSNTSFLYCACMCTSMYMYMYMYGHVHACVLLVPSTCIYFIHKNNSCLMASQFLDPTYTCTCTCMSFLHVSSVL